MHKITIVGAGNIGIACAVDLSKSTDNVVTVYTHKANKFGSCLKKIDMDTNEVVTSDSVFITDNKEKAFSNCDIVIVTLPSFLIENFVNDIINYNPKIIYYVPGYGGKELYSKILSEKGIIIAGLERVPYIARLQTFNEVYASKKTSLACATLNSKDTEFACALLEKLFDIPCIRIQSYLTVSFTPSNPILHTSRLFSMFENCNFETTLQKQIKFYAEWNDYSSENLICMDKELDNIVAKVEGVNVSQYKSICTHYESFDIESMTKKITSIKAFQNILSPLIETDTGDYKIDSKSRYFEEDFLYGLLILKSFAEILAVDTPYMNKVLIWYGNLIGLKILDDNMNLILDNLKEYPILNNFGICTIQDIIQNYK